MIRLRSKKNTYIHLADGAGEGFNIDIKSGAKYFLRQIGGRVYDVLTGTQFYGSLAPFTPEEITTTAWFDASDTGTITQSAGDVSQWSDKSGNGNHATQGTASSQPRTGDATINGKNVLSFGGYSDTNFLETTLTQLTTVSMYYVLNPTVNGANQNNTVLSATETAWNDGGAFINVEDYLTTAARHTGRAFNSSYLNGVLSEQNHGFSPAFFSHHGTGVTTVGQSYHIGHNRFLGQEWPYNGTMGEIIICPADHDATTRQKFEGYLAHKWGLTALLPAGHPYKVYPPAA